MYVISLTQRQLRLEAHAEDSMLHIELLHQPPGLFRV